MTCAITTPADQPDDGRAHCELRRDANEPAVLRRARRRQMTNWIAVHDHYKGRLN